MTDGAALPPLPTAPPAAGTGARLAAGVGGLLLTGLGIIATGGTVLAGLLAIGAAAGVARGRGRALTRVPAFVAGAVGALLGWGALFGWAFAQGPGLDFDKVVAAADSARATSAAPAWLERAAPGTTERMRQGGTADQVALAYGGLVGLVIAGALLGSWSGGFAWVCATLLRLAFVGRAFPRKAALAMGAAPDE